MACEFSGIVRDAFIAAGHTAMSCDLLPTEQTGPHYQGDIFDVVSRDWDLMIAHPPCQFLSVSGARWWKDRRTQQEDAVKFFLDLYGAAIPHIAIENPIGIMSSTFRKPDQIYQPWWFGEGETKATCLWLNNVPPLLATKMGWSRSDRIHKLPPSAERWRERSRTLPGVAAAMAQQWGHL